MDQQNNQQAAAVASGQPHVQYGMAPGVQPAGVMTGQPSSGYPAAQMQPMGYQNIHMQQLQHFWATQRQEIEQVTDFKNHQLPLARIKKIMKADEDVKMISAEAPVLFAKACEMFTLELTLRSWMHAEENKRRTLQRNDIAAAITRTDIFDFLVDIVPRDEVKEDGLPVARAGLPPADAVPYGGMYYMAQPQAPGYGAPIQPVAQNVTGSPAYIVGRPAMHMDPSMYMTQLPGMPYAPPQMWPVPPAEEQAEAPPPASPSENASGS
ncbi:hypothetical protein GOP47_0029139 [Adiantum capillus-veneris]|nr:hypothetical protein GOP47_0029139 [Adiantum capillus-veneris]